MLRCITRLVLGTWMFVAATTTASPLVSQQPPVWSLTFRYGGGTPIDAGPLGHCTATFTSDGKVRIESKGRQGASRLPEKGVRPSLFYQYSPEINPQPKGSAPFFGQAARGPRDVLVWENPSLPSRQLEELTKAADAALKESVYWRNGENQDGFFLRLERKGESPASVFHSQMKDFSEAPPAMRSFVLLMNELLPGKERIPLKKTRLGSSG